MKKYYLHLLDGYFVQDADLPDYKHGVTVVPLADHEAAMALKDEEIRLLREQRDCLIADIGDECAISDEEIKSEIENQDARIQSALQRLAKG